VQQRLAIANLYAPILNAYRREEIDPATIRHLTMATKKQQKAWWKLFRSEDTYAPLGRSLKDWLFGGQHIPVSNALFDLEDYRGAIIGDLFGDERYFADGTLFWEYQSRAIGGMIAEYRAEGWQDVVLLDVGQHWPCWDHVPCDKADGGRVYIVCAADGEISVHEGYITEKEHAKRSRGEKQTEKPVRPELTKAMGNYLALHRHAAVRTELLASEGIVLRLALAQMIAGSALWTVNADPHKAHTEAIAQSVGGSASEQMFAQEREAVLGLLELDGGGHDTLVPKASDYGRSHDTGAIFAKLCAMMDGEVNRIFAYVVAETLPAGSDLVETLGMMLGVDMGRFWAPDQTFFDLLRDKEAINAIVAEVAGDDVAKVRVSSTAKVQKEVIQRCLEDKQTAEMQDWQPRPATWPFRCKVIPSVVGSRLGCITKLQ